ncbi:Uncharacterised protein [Mycobacteroides abscessus subsp. abscessus]|nr:Uncharacterised protein [Mycobacteroides abscessus subsp. abscessus]
MLPDSYFLFNEHRLSGFRWSLPAVILPVLSLFLIFHLLFRKMVKFKKGLLRLRFFSPCRGKAGRNQFLSSGSICTFKSTIG